MNKRQKKKLYKQTLIKVRKLHPHKGDIICFEPNFDIIDIDILNDLLKGCNSLFKDTVFAIVPADMRWLQSKDAAQIYVNELQDIVNKMEENEC